MHISGGNRGKAVAGVPRESSSGSDSFSWRERCASQVLAGRPMAGYRQKPVNRAG